MLLLTQQFQEVVEGKRLVTECGGDVFNYASRGGGFAGLVVKPKSRVGGVLPAVGMVGRGW
jgi:hypothetical protein